MAVSRTPTPDDVLQAIRVENTPANLKAMTRLRNAVAHVVQNHVGPHTPEDVEDQAIIQVCGYVWHAPASAPARINFANAMLNSGAAALLAPWRCHAAGVIG